MEGGLIGEAGLSHRAVHRLWEDGFVKVMPLFFAGLLLLLRVLLRKDPLPVPLLGRVGIFAVESAGQQHAAPTVD